MGKREKRKKKQASEEVKVNSKLKKKSKSKIVTRIDQDKGHPNKQVPITDIAFPL